LTLQLQTNSVLRLLVVDCSSNGLLRGMARWHDNVNDNAAEIAEDASFPELCAGGHLVITIDPGSGGERYQGIVDLAGDSLTEALEFYFQRSEQLPTQLHLVADQNSAAGLLLQRLPEETVDADAWNRIQHLGRTLKENELLRLDTRTLIHRLFHEETVRLFEGTPLAFRCSCSRERTEAMLISLGYTEVRSILAEEGVVEVGCQFCGMQYHFDAVDAEQLFAASVQPEVPTTRH
jgi:molecular chaperone Hsp33